MECMACAVHALEWEVICSATSVTKLAVQMEKIHTLHILFHNSFHVRNIHHVTQVRFAASVPEGKSRTSVLKSSFTLSGGIIQQQ